MIKDSSFSPSAPLILWLRREFRLADHPALAAAAGNGRPVISVFIHDESVEAMGAAARLRLSLAIAAFACRLGDLGSRLVLRRGPAAETLAALAAETGAGAVFWTRHYDPAGREAGAAVKRALAAAGVQGRSFPGHVLFEPWTVETGTGGFYKVYSPFWRAVKDRAVRTPDPAPARLPVPDRWPRSEVLESWRMAAAMGRGGGIVAGHACVGEAAARSRLDAFLDGPVAGYKAGRDHPAGNATSRLSENLAWGEIGAATIWHAAQAAREAGAAGAEHFLKELVWRDFAWHLMYHSPEIDRANWKEGWDEFPWSGDAANPGLIAWQRGRTGVPFVDAGMRQMYVTGHMHNRLRMITASFLTKHLLVHWRLGKAWFEDCLTDWDPASNAMGWQWVAGSGPDAAPYFRIFNPATQAEKFDADGAFRRTWIAEGQADPPATALDYFRAVPKSWKLSPDDPYPAPITDLKRGRERALAAYQARTG